MGTKIISGRGEEGVELIGRMSRGAEGGFRGSRSRITASDE